MILYIWEVSSEGPCIGAHHCQKGHTTGGRRLPIIMASMATTVSQQRHQSRQIFAPTISPILLVIDWSAYIGYIWSVCVAVAIGRPLVGAAASWLMSKNGSICRVNGRVMRSTSPYVGIRHLEPVEPLLIFHFSTRKILLRQGWYSRRVSYWGRTLNTALAQNRSFFSSPSPPPPQKNIHTWRMVLKGK